MKALLLILLCCGTTATAADIQLRVVRKGLDVVMPKETPLATNVIALIQSCTVYSSAGSRPARWAETLASDSFVHLKFAEPAKLRFEGPSNQGREEYSVNEILVGLPEGKWGGPFLVKSGAYVYAFGKYDARYLKKVALEPALKLSSAPPYDQLAKFPDPKQ